MSTQDQEKKMEQQNPPSPPITYKADLFIEPGVLQGRGIKLSPLGFRYEEGLAAAAADGELWNNPYTFIPAPQETHDYIKKAYAMREEGSRFAYAVLDPNSDTILGTTSYHDLDPEAKTLFIGYTWYAQCMQRSYVNTACKFVMLSHAFQTLNCISVGFQADILNIKSQKAIERLGAKQTRVLKEHMQRKDGSMRDTVQYQITAQEWPEVNKHLIALMDKYK